MKRNSRRRRRPGFMTRMTAYGPPPLIKSDPVQQFYPRGVAEIRSKRNRLLHHKEESFIPFERMRMKRRARYFIYYSISIVLIRNCTTIQTYLRARY